MLFNSIQFLFFFLVVTSVFFCAPQKYKWLILLVSSCYFYMVFVPIYILILAFTIVIDYFAGIYIEKSIGIKRKHFLILSLVANVAILSFFKYYNFLNENLRSILGLVNIHASIPYLSILLPIGLSFHTFQAMSYTIEVYRGNQKPERHFGIYALYVMFYPQLVAGPIERPQNILYQFHSAKYFEYERVTSGLRLMAWGLFKKVVIADRLSIVVDTIYQHPHGQNGFNLLLATFFFSFQIYCDFSGYSDMAIGAARVMDFKLMRNFNSPYFSKSISEFWQRWHISLSTWFRDYLYIPLGGNRVSIPRWYLNLFLVFIISGLWHGANWTFIIWGAIHGFYLVVGLMTKKIRILLSQNFKLFKIPILSIIATFSLVTFSWIFFRSRTISDAFIISRKILFFIPELFRNVAENKSIFTYYGIMRWELYLSFFLIVFLLSIEYFNKNGKLKMLFLKQKPLVRWIVYYGYFASIFFLGVNQSKSFIYFQF